MPLILDSATYGGLFLTPDNQPYNWLRFEETARELANEWLSKTQVLNHLNLGTDDSQWTSGLLTQMELATRMFIEEFLGRAIFARSFKAYYSPVVFQNPITGLDLPNARTTTTVDSVSYYDTSFPPVLQPISNDLWFFDESGQRVVLQNFSSAINPNVTAPVVVDFTLEADPIASYPNVQQAGLMYLAHLYSQRTMTTNEKSEYVLGGVQQLLLPYQQLIM